MQFSNSLVPTQLFRNQVHYLNSQPSLTHSVRTAGLITEGEQNNFTEYIVRFLSCVIHAVKNTTICQMVSLLNIQHYVIYNYMFRPGKLAINRLFIEPVISLYKRGLGGRDLVLHHILWGFYRL